MLKFLKTILLTAALCVPWLTQAQQTLTVADGTSTNAYIPFQGNYVDWYNHSQFVYGDTMLTGLLNQSILSMTFYSSATSPLTWNNVTFTVKMMAVDWTPNTFNTVAFIDTTMTTVYTGSVAMIGGQMTIELDEPFTYTGGDLLIDFSQNTTGTYGYCSFYGIDFNDASIHGTNSSSYSAISPSQRNFLPKVTFTYDTPNSCTKPTALNGVAGTDNIALSWTAGGNESSWIISDGTNEYLSNTTSYTIQNLNINTIYNITVRAICGVGDTSYALQGSFRTLAGDPISDLPFVSTFEDSDTNAIWVLENGSEVNKWAIGHAVSASGDSALYISNDNGATNTYSTSNVTSVFAYVTFAFQPGDYSVAYDWRNEGESNYDFIRVALIPSALDVTAGVNTYWSYSSLPTDAIALDGGNRLQGYSAWQHKDAVFSITQSGNYKLVFFWRNDGGGGSNPPAAIDNVVVSQLTCPQPTDLAVSGITTDEITLSWTPAGNETSWAVSNGIDVDYVTDTFYTFSELAASASYTLSVAAICGPDDTSFWSNIQASTACGNISVFPYYESFESEASFNCWTTFDLDGNTSDNWTRYSSSTAFDGQYFARTTYNSSTNANDWLITPALELPDNGNPISMIWNGSGSTYSNFSTGMTVLVSTTDNDSVQYFTDTLYSGIIADGWSEFTADLSDYAGETIYIAFIHNTYNDNGLYIDNIRISEGTPCVSPTSIAISNVSTTSADLTINDPLQVESYRVWIYAGNTFVDSTDVYQTTYSFTNLNLNTNYTVTVATLCENDVLSPTVSTSFTTLASEAISDFPFTCTFENADTNSLWTIVNGSETNKWYIGDADASTGDSALYISNDNGATNAYSNSDITSVFAFVTFAFEAGEYAYSYDWKNNGESNYDFIRAALVPSGTELTAGNNTGWSSTLLPAGAIAIDGGSQLVSSTTWQQRTGSFTITQDNSYKLVFFWRNDGSAGSNPPAAIDNLHIERLSCPQPVNLTVTDLTSTSVTLSWTPMGSETAWYVGDLATVSVASDTFFTFTNLNPATSYTFVVAAICGPDDNSLPDTIDVFTSCDVITSLPYSEDFSVQTALNCWSTFDLDNNTSDNWSYSTSSGAYMTTSFNESANANDWLVTPSIQLPVNATGYRLVWSASGSNYNADSTGMTVMISTTGADSVQAFTDTLFYQNVIPNGWNSYTANLNSYTGQTVNIAFIHNSYNDNGLSIDDILVEEIPACVAPDSLSAVVDTTSIALSWVAGGDETAWVVSDGTNQYLANTTSYTLTGLTPGTVYTLSVRSICGPGDTSVAVSRAFSTMSLPVTAIPFVCDFENAAQYSYWHSVNGNEPNGWFIGSGANNTTGGSNALYVSNNNGVSNTYTGTATTIWSECTLLLNAGDYIFSYDWRNLGDGAYHYLRAALVPATTEFQAGLIGGWSSSSLPAGAIALDGGSYLSGSSTWLTETTEVHVADTGLYKLVFLWTNDTYNPNDPPAAVDNISITLNTCPVVASIYSTDVTTSSITVDWNASAEATSWQLQYGPANFALGTGTSVFTATHPYTITGLDSLTAYDVWIRPICGAGDTGSWAGVRLGTVFCDNSDSYTIGNVAGNAYTTNTMPIATYYNYSMTEVIIDSTEILGLTEIDGIQLYYYSETALTNDTSIDIYIQPTNKTVFANANDMTPVDTLTAVKVFHGSFANVVPGWNTFVFDTTFTYSGVGNLLVIFKKNSHAYVGGANFVALECTGNKTISWYNDSSDPDIFDTSTFATYNRYVYERRPYMTLVSCGAGCPAPTALSASSITYSTATLNWSGNADSYEVSYKEASAATWPEAVAVTTSTYDVTGLVPATNYQFMVRAVCDASEGIYSDWVTGTFVTDSLPCFTPTALIATAGYVTAELSWTADDSQTQWTVNVWNSSFNQEFDATANPFTVTGLAQNTEYYAAVKAICGGGAAESEYSDTISFTTNTCAVVTGVVANAVDAHTATVNWNSTGAASYEVNYGDRGFQQGQGQTITVTNNSANLTGLLPEKNYDVYVRAICEQGVNSLWSEVAQFTTPAGDGINAVDGGNLVIYPNPTTSATTIALSGVNGEVTITVVDMNGRVVLSDSMSCEGDCTKTMEVAGLAQGAYFVRINGENVNMVKKLVVK